MAGVGTGISWKIETPTNYTKLKCTLTHPSKTSNGTNIVLFIGNEHSRTVDWTSLYREQIDTSYGSYNLRNINNQNTFTEPQYISTTISGNQKLFYIGFQVWEQGLDKSGSRIYRIYELKLE